MIGARRVQRPLRPKKSTSRLQFKRFCILWLLGSGDVCAGLAGGQPPADFDWEDDSVDFFQQNVLSEGGPLSQELLYRELPFDEGHRQQEGLFAEDVNYLEALTYDRAFFDQVWILRGVEDEVEHHALRFESKTASSVMIVNRLYHTWHGIWEEDWKLTRIDVEFSS